MKNVYTALGDAVRPWFEITNKYLWERAKRIEFDGKFEKLLKEWIRAQAHANKAAEGAAEKSFQEFFDKVTTDDLDRAVPKRDT